MEKITPIKHKISSIVSIIYNCSTCISGLIALFLGFVDDDVLKSHHLDILTKCITGVACLMLAIWIIVSVIIPKIKNHIETNIINSDNKIKSIQNKLTKLEEKKQQLIKLKNEKK